MAKCTQKSRDPFVVTGARTVDEYVLRQIMSERPGLLSECFESIPSIYPWEKLAEFSTVCVSRNEGEREVRLKQFRRRLLSAALGGAFLIGPMWLTVLLDSWRYTALVVTSVFVSLFGLVMAALLDESKDIMANTAAYAAVLVVFVGTNNPSFSQAVQ